MVRGKFFVAVALVLLGIMFPVRAAEPSTGGRVNNLKVLSDKIDDVTTPENILKSFVKPALSPAQRSEAIWHGVVKYRHQTIPPNEFLAADWEAHDPVKVFNVYGYCMCCCSSALVAALNRLDGREARGRIINGHSVPEVKYGEGWHMYDASLITYFPKPGAKEVASVDEIGDSIKCWLDKNPTYKGNKNKIDELMRSDGWNGYKKGPELLANCPFYQAGFFPARTHGWNDTMGEYNVKSDVYEYGYQFGHKALFSLRPGESFVREASHRGLHVNMIEDPNFVGLRGKVPVGDLAYVPQYMPGYRGGIVANGTHRYAPDLAAGGLARGADVYENLATGGSPALHLATGGKKGTAVIQMASPYVYLDGKLTVKAVRKTEADHVTISISTNNGRTFQPLWSAEKLGTTEVTIPLQEAILRRYAYWLKIEMESSTTDGAGLESFAIVNDMQHAPRTLPWLGKGDNTITVAADNDPKIASRSFAGRITADTKFSKNVTTAALGVTTENIDLKHESYWWKGGTGIVTQPIETPGPITSLRFGGHFRARDAKDIVKISFSWDEGKTWKPVATVTGPTQGRTEFFKATDVPTGVTKGLIRYELTGRNTVGILSLRADVEYQDPLASTTFQPFAIVYRWQENGTEKTHREQVTKLALPVLHQGGK